MRCAAVRLGADCTAAAGRAAGFTATARTGIAAGRLFAAFAGTFLFAAACCGAVRILGEAAGFTVLGAAALRIPSGFSCICAGFFRGFARAAGAFDTFFAPPDAFAGAFRAAEEAAAFAGCFALLPDVFAPVFFPAASISKTGRLRFCILSFIKIIHSMCPVCPKKATHFHYRVSIFANQPICVNSPRHKTHAFV